MNPTNPTVDFYFHKAKKWQLELEHLRRLVLDCGLREELKWGVPCYTFEKGNVLLLHVFKDYCAVLFHKVALLRDAEGILVRQTANTQATRQVRFTGVAQIVGREAVLRAYVQEAIAVEKAGLKVEFKKSGEFEMPEELQDKLAEDVGLKTAFHALTPGRQRAYLLYFAAPKQAKTRAARVEKCVARILGGKGLDE